MFPQASCCTPVGLMAAVLFLSLLAISSSELQVDRSNRSNYWAQCGVKGHPRQRIVNGHDAGECTWRWQVSLNSEDDLFCGGTLITPEWVLTAAHCLVGENLDVPCLTIGAGTYSKSQQSKGDSSDSAVRRVLAYYVHPLYSKYVSNDYDFMLLRLDKAVPINGCVGTACLPSKSPVTGSTCSITGWGTLESGGVQPEFLQEAPVELLSEQICQAQYAPKDDTITSSMMCATGHSAGGITDSCQGDSGGPLVCQEDGRYIVHGVVSWGEGCGTASFPGVYSRVASGLPWIQDVLGGKVEHANWKSPDDFSNVNFNGQMFAVVSGACQVDEQGCVSSPGFAYGSTYNTGEKCQIAVNPEWSRPLRVESFSTESGYDKLKVNCREYSGSMGPSGVIPASSIAWESDGDTVNQGWKLCPSW